MDFKFLKNIVLDRLHITKYWRKKRKFNIGDYSYVCHNVKMNKNVYIGKFCSIADHVCIGMGGHPYHLLTTSPITYYRHKIDLYGDCIVKDENLIERPPARKTYIGNDVWVGYRAIILQGVKIGDGAIIGAGAVVTKDVEPYSIVGGVPAKHIKYRFDEDICKELLESKWWDLPKDFIITLPFEDINKCIEKVKEYKKIFNEN